MTQTTMTARESRHPLPEFLARQLAQGRAQLAERRAATQHMREAAEESKQRRRQEHWAAVVEHARLDLGQNLWPFVRLRVPREWTGRSARADLAIELPAVGFLAACYLHRDGRWHRTPYSAANMAGDWGVVTHQRLIDPGDGRHKLAAAAPAHWPGFVTLGDALAYAEEETERRLKLQAACDEDNRLLEEAARARPTALDTPERELLRALRGMIAREVAALAPRE